MMPAFASLVEQFRFEGQFLEAQPYGFGHINDTYVARFRQSNGAERRYILQRINHFVFKNPVMVMENIQRVTDHLRRKVIANGGDPNRETITLVPTIDGASFYRTPEGHYWRAHLFIEGARAYQTATSPNHYYHAARAFGRFQSMLSDFPLDQLHVTIPDFHHTGKRFLALVDAVEQDVAKRARSARAEIDFVMQRAKETTVFIDLLEQKRLPERVTHNDTKFDNVMIDDETGEGICVIDLDTVMPGLALYDFGDAVRSAANPAGEDERDLSRVGIDLGVFDRLTHGYLEATRGFLTELEVDHLAFSARLITLEQAIRFLTDHLNGDVYYKIHREGHNLDRCRTQIKLVSDMEEKYEQMLAVVDRYR